MSEREAFQIFIRFQLKNAVEEGKLDITPADIERIAIGVEDDPSFYDQLNDMLADYVETFGENFGVNC